LPVYQRRFFRCCKYKSSSRCRGQGDRKPSAISDEIYDAMVKLVKGEALPSVKEKSMAEK